VSELEFNVPFQHKHDYIRDEDVWVTGKTVWSLVNTCHTWAL